MKIPNSPAAVMTEEVLIKTAVFETQLVKSHWAIAREGESRR